MCGLAASPRHHGYLEGARAISLTKLRNLRLGYETRSRDVRLDIPGYWRIAGTE